MKKIAIVGADEEKWKKANISLGYVDTTIFKLCLELYNKHGQFILVSGGCPKGGVDIIAESVADELIGGFLGGHNPLIHQKAIFLPDEEKWSCRGLKWGYKERNLVIAAYSDIVYCIDPKGVKSGGNWTLEQAKKIGRETYRIEL